MKYINITIASLIIITILSCNPNGQDATIDEKAIINNHEEMEKPVLIHTVFFWTKEGTTDEQKKAFEQGLVKLGTCPQIQAFFWGPPAPTEARGVVDNTYDYAINVHFESLEKQAEYQVEPIHKAFIADHEDLWGKVIVYDNVVK